MDIVQPLNLSIREKKSSPKILVLSSGGLNIRPIEKFVDLVFNEEEQLENVNKLMIYLKEYINKDSDNIDIIENNHNVQYLQSDIIPSIKIDNSSIIRFICCI